MCYTGPRCEGACSVCGEARTTHRNGKRAKLHRRAFPMLNRRKKTNGKTISGTRLCQGTVSHHHQRWYRWAWPVQPPLQCSAAAGVANSRAWEVSRSPPSSSPAPSPKVPSCAQAFRPASTEARTLRPERRTDGIACRTFVCLWSAQPNRSDRGWSAWIPRPDPLVPHTDASVLWGTAEMTC